MITFEIYMKQNFNLDTHTTAWQDLSIAERFITVEPNAVESTFSALLDYCKSNIDYMIELLFAVNTKCWSWYERKNEKLTSLYADFCDRIKDYVYGYYDEATDTQVPGHYTEKERRHFFELTD